MRIHLVAVALVRAGCGESQLIEAGNEAGSHTGTGLSETGTDDNWEFGL